MKSNTNCYRKQLGTKYSVIMATGTIFHPSLYVSTIKDIADIPISL